MRFIFNTKITLLLIVFFSFLFLSAANANALSQDTLAPATAIPADKFKKSFISYRSLRGKLQQIKSVYEEEMQYIYINGERLTFDESGKSIGLLWLSDFDDINFILDNIPISERTKACDLGSGIGNVCCLFAARGAEAIGYEIDGYLRDMSESIVRHGLKGIVDPSRVCFKRANFMDEDLSQYDVIYYYGHGFLGEREPEFKAKLIRELKPGALLIIYLGGEILKIPELPEAEYLPGYKKIKHMVRIYTKYDSFISRKEAVLNNRIINMLFERDKAEKRDGPVLFLRKLLADRSFGIIDEMIGRMEREGEGYLDARGKRVLKEFGEMPVNAEYEKTEDWREFAAKDTSGDYDLSQLLANLTFSASWYFNWFKTEKSKKEGAKEDWKEAFEEAFCDLYCTLRSMEIASRRTNHGTTVSDEIYVNISKKDEELNSSRMLVENSI